MSNAEDVIPKSFAGRRVTVMGLGQFGGGLGAVRFLLDRGAQVTLTDLRTADRLANSLAGLELSQLHSLVLGRHELKDFTTAELVVVNPAVRQQGNVFLTAALEAGATLTSEMNLFWDACHARKIVVTGSNGKSTTATLIHQCLQSAGFPVRLGGNIGVSLLPEVRQITADEWVVLELSSFQLSDLNRLRPAPDVSVVTNFTPNHLDWHGTLEEYRAAKQAALRWQTESQFAVLNADDADVSCWPGAAKRIWFGGSAQADQSVRCDARGLTIRSGNRQEHIPRELLASCLRFPHGMADVAAALGTVVLAAKASLEQVLPALQQYKGLTHRMQSVGNIQERTFINDSKATTPQATLAAITSLSTPTILIAGGKDKGIDMSEFVASAVKHLKAVVLLGDLAPRLLEQIQQEVAASPRQMRDQDHFVCIADNMDEAVRQAWELSAPGDVILLSPGCASHAEFAHYEDRGNTFTRCVQSLQAGMIV